ncbi:hypothetical protein D6745_02005 [Candidatus Woesearchaeota archaeon]|nr:MAG: hypothetical protein D6745_02005 [Candidatus Woesearchaeota archaeon]
MRTYNKKRYFLAFVLTVAVFLFGLLLGLVIEGKRVAYIEDKTKAQNLEFSSLQLQYQYIDQLSREENCEAVTKTFNEYIKTLEEARIRLENYKEDATLRSQEFDLLWRDYTIAQLRYWLLAKRTKEICDEDYVTVLYFYSTKKECPDCEEQAFVLTYFKKLLKDKILIFALDSNFEQEPMISILKKTFEVSTYPTIVVQDEKFEGLVDKKELKEVLCSLYKTENELCTES